MFQQPSIKSERLDEKCNFEFQIRWKLYCFPKKQQNRTNFVHFLVSNDSNWKGFDEKTEKQQNGKTSNKSFYVF